MELLCGGSSVNFLCQFVPTDHGPSQIAIEICKVPNDLLALSEACPLSFFSLPGFSAFLLGYFALVPERKSPADGENQYDAESFQEIPKTSLFN